MRKRKGGGKKGRRGMISKRRWEAEEGGRPRIVFGEGGKGEVWGGDLKNRTIMGSLHNAARRELALQPLQGRRTSKPRKSAFWECKGEDQLPGGDAGNSGKVGDDRRGILCGCAMYVCMYV